MARSDKLVASMRANPRDWAMGDIERVCRACGLECEAPTRGSHYKIFHPSLATILTIPYNRPIKPVYVKALIQMIDQLESKS